MVRNYYCPRLEISSETYFNNSEDCIGQIKYELEYDKLKDELFKNEACVEFFKQSSRLSYFPLTNYYSDDIKKIFDLYGGEITRTLNGKNFKIKLYFYSVKNPELITKDTILKHRIIFEQSNYNETNILNPDYHNYRMKIFAKDIETKFFDTTFPQPSYCKSQLYFYQRHNINWMLKIHDGIKIKISDNILIHFDYNLIYDIVSQKFIEESDIPEYTICSGILMDEPGIGKTLQIIIYLIEIMLKNNFESKRTLIIVPDNLKSHWIEEFKLHTIYSLSELPIDIMTLKEVNDMLRIDKKILDQYYIHIYDELHIIYRSHQQIYEALVQSKVKHKWGLTSTPFIRDTSISHILNLLIGKKFCNERIGYIPSVQKELSKLFLKNTKNNTIKEHSWPEIVINNHILELDVIQQTTYDTEAKSLSSVDKLMVLASDILVRFDTDIQTPKDLKNTVYEHYKKEYETEIKELNDIKESIDNLEKHEEKMELEIFTIRMQTLLQQLKKKMNDVHIKKSAYEYFTNTIHKLNVLAEKMDTKSESDSDSETETDYDDVCAICLNEHQMPITYIKKCGHYFCTECFNEIKTNLCPLCKRNFTNDDLIRVQTKADILLNSKYTKIYELLNSTKDKFIIFTQYPKIITNMLKFLNKYEIAAADYKTYILLNKSEQDELRVVVLSSEDSSSGLDFSSKNRVIIYEPFLDHMYSREIEKQLIGRVHRLRQTKTVYIDRLIMNKTIEREIYSKYNIEL
jgi:SNF2 family DNA or RNA helicase